MLAIQSWGYAGTIAPGSVWANMQKGLGRRYWVESGASVRCTPVVGGTRQIQLTSGYFGGWGVLDYNDATATIQLPIVGSGTRFYLIVARRTWGATNATTFVAIDGGTSSATLPARNTTPGTLDDQPLWLVPLTAGNDTPGTPIDVRAVGAGDGPFRSGSDLARQYMDFEGVQLAIGTNLWTREPDGAGNPQWVKDPGVTDRVNLPVATQNAVWTSEAGWSGTDQRIRAVRQGNLVDLRIELKRTGARVLVDANGGIVGGDIKIGTVNTVFCPSEITPFTYTYLGGAAETTFASWGGHATIYPATGPNAQAIILNSASPNQAVNVSSGSTWAFRAHLTFLQETV